MDYMMKRVIPVRFEGMDASNQNLDMYQFGQSLIGIHRILKNSAHFAMRHEYAERRSKANIQILAQPPKKGSFILEAIALAQTQYPLLMPMMEEATWKLITVTANAILLGRSDKEKALNKALDTIDKLVEQQGIDRKDERRTLEGIAHRLIDTNQQAVRQALSPVGETCESLQVGDTRAGATPIDFGTADIIRSDENVEIGSAKNYYGKLDSLTKHTRSCTVELKGKEGSYVRGTITDPELQKNKNIYTQAFHESSQMKFTAKALVTEDGEIKKLYILDASIASSSQRRSSNDR